MIYEGSCHCGDIDFAVDATIDSLLECNCSICSRKGSLLFFVPRSKLELKTPEIAMNTYRFNTRKIGHKFCRTCGCAPFGFGADAEGNEVAAINARCLENVDLSQFPIHHHDGRSV
jgi:hypothetical protein